MFSPVSYFSSFIPSIPTASYPPPGYDASGFPIKEEQCVAVAVTHPHVAVCSTALNTTRTQHAS